MRIPSSLWRRNGGRRPWTPLHRRLLRVSINAAALGLASQLLPGVVLESWVAAVVGGLLLGLVNAWVRPALYVLTFPITLGTLGFFLHVLDAVCLWFIARITPGLEVHGIAALVLTSLIVWGLNRMVTGVLGDDRELVLRRPSSLPRERREGDVSTP